MLFQSDSLNFQHCLIINNPELFPFLPKWNSFLHPFHKFDHYFSLTDNLVDPSVDPMDVQRIIQLIFQQAVLNLYLPSAIDQVESICSRCKNSLLFRVSAYIKSAHRKVFRKLCNHCHPDTMVQYDILQHDIFTVRHIKCRMCPCMMTKD